MKKTLLLSLLIASSISVCASCNNSFTSNGDNSDYSETLSQGGTTSNGGNTTSNNQVSIPTFEKPSVPEVDVEITDKPIIDETGKTTYKIVVPANNTSKHISIAAQELKDLIYEATNIELPIIDDSEISSVSEEDTYLSIGRTKVFNKSGITADFETLGADGLRLYTYGSSIVMVGGGDRGSMYAAYEFLERQFNFETYAGDEYYIDTGIKELNLRKYDITEIPVFERRSVGLFSYTNDETFRNRMRQEFYSEDWIYWSHSHFKIMPLDIYYDSHKDWYAPDKSQLCLTNDEMRKEFSKNVIQLIKDNPKSTYISLGQEDVNKFCTCSNCKTEVAKYKESGVTIRFTNKVAKDVQDYIDKYEPGREFYLSTFAYQKTQNAPVDANKKPLDESVKPASNVRIMIAPIYACNSHHYYDTCNADINSLFADWNVVAQGQIYTWIYNKIFSNYFIPFNNYSTLVDNYNILHNIGTKFVYHQGNKETEAGGMQELKSYVEAKLMWDNSQSPDKLAEDFIEHYYKDAAPYYEEYYKLVRYSYAMWELDGLHCYNSTSKAEAIADTKYWTRDLVDQFNELFLKMFESIEKFKTTDEEYYEKMNLRIQKEYLTVRYFYLLFYFDEFSYADGKVMLDEFEYYCKKVGISVWREMYLTTSTHMLISSFVTSKREELNQK